MFRALFFEVSHWNQLIRTQEIGNCLYSCCTNSFYLNQCYKLFFFPSFVCEFQSLKIQFTHNVKRLFCENIWKYKPPVPFISVCIMCSGIVGVYGIIFIDTSITMLWLLIEPLIEKNLVQCIFIKWYSNSSTKRIIIILNIYLIVSFHPKQNKNQNKHMIIKDMTIISCEWCIQKNSIIFQQFQKKSHENICR